MEQEVIDGIKVLGTEQDENKNESSFSLVAANSRNIKKTLSVMQTTGILNIAFNSQWGWSPLKSIDFIKNYPWIEGVAIIDNGVDVAAVNDLPNLKRIQMPDKLRGVLDFARFRHLETCTLKWNEKQILNLEACQELRHLNISSYNKEDLSQFKVLEKLQCLKILYSRITSLRGIETLPLQKIFLWSLPRLMSLEYIQCFKMTLKSLQLYNCRVIDNYAAISVLESLEKIQIVDSSPLPSTDIFDRLTNLKSGFIGVEIQDKKTELLGQRGIGFRHYKSYLI